MSAKAPLNDSRGAEERPVLAVTMGDPCGIGPEVLLKALADPRCAAARLLVCGDESWLRKTARDLRLRWPFAGVVNDFLPNRRWDRPLLLDLKNVPGHALPGQISAEGGRAAGQAIEKAVALAMDRLVDGIVTAPIHKEALSLSGYHDPGHTEMLARLTGTRRVAMVFWTGDFMVSNLTTHLSLREAIGKVRKKKILDHLQLLDREWQRFFHQKPKIGVAALNPHGGEGNRFGTEESREVIPAIEAARAAGIVAYGPISADSIFTQARDGQFELVLALYHDQATIPVKTLYGKRAVNVTFGLPFIRTSVDHGTAMDIAGKGMATEESLVQAVLCGVRFARSTRTAG